MCVAVLVESDKPISLEDLQRMERANPDGGGLAWCAGGMVHFRKGLKAREIHALQDALPRPYLMHYRIATRGASVPELTHPFPIGIQAFDPDLAGFTPHGVIIHNGTWSDFEKWIPGGIDPKSVSDTQVAAYLVGFDEAVLDSVRWSNAIMRVSPEGHPDVTLRGQWTEVDGNQYSNTHWRGWQGLGSYTTRSVARGPYTESEWDYDQWSQWADRERGTYKGGTRTGTLPPPARTLPAGSKVDRRSAKRVRRVERLRAKRIAEGVPLDLVDLMERASAKGVEIEPSDEDLMTYLAHGGDPGDFLDAEWEAVNGAIEPSWRPSGGTTITGFRAAEDSGPMCAVSPSPGGFPRGMGRGRIL